MKNIIIWAGLAIFILVSVLTWHHFQYAGDSDIRQTVGARRVFEQKTVWLRCSSTEDQNGYTSSTRPALQLFAHKQHPLKF
jgi:hypothetical protein